MRNLQRESYSAGFYLEFIINTSLVEAIRTWYKSVIAERLSIISSDQSVACTRKSTKNVFWN
jgi:hypothetical protein